MICLVTSCEKDRGFDTGSVPSYVETEDYVDLGLGGLLFATKNVGAKNPEDSGDFFAWGEVKPKSYYIYDRVNFSRYYYKNGKPDYPYLLPEDDAATVILSDGLPVRAVCP